MGFVVIGRNANAGGRRTAGGSDMVGPLCRGAVRAVGRRANEDSLHYLFNGACIAMDRRVHRTLDAAPPGLPGRELLPEIIVERTVHGPVVARGRIGDKPVAVSRKRSTYLKELDAAIAILHLNRNQVPNGETFVRDFTRSMNLSTNWTYANASEIAYVHGGLYPVRPPGAHPDLPVWGTGTYEWQRDPGLAHVARIKDPGTDNDDVYLSDLASPEQLSLHPHEVRPERHYIVSWNNRPATRLVGVRRRLGLVEHLPRRPARGSGAERDCGRAQDQPGAARADHGARGDSRICAARMCCRRRSRSCRTPRRSVRTPRSGSRRSRHGPRAGPTSRTRAGRCAATETATASTTRRQPPGSWMRGGTR
jgi:hypothetical protein